MKYAIINGTKSEAVKNLKGLCPNCGSELIAKCGNFKINHWAHKSKRNCDTWWEPETEWHRNWKNNYPAEWQEIILFDEQTNEKHIADIQTIHNLVIEFQHSAIKSEERISREKFYKNMLWVVDGSRLQRDYPRFQKSVGNFKLTKQQGVYVVDFPDEVFPKSWLNGSVPVIFDFCGLTSTDKDEIKNTLWCLLPQKDITQAVVVGLGRNDFVQMTHERSHLFSQNEKPQQNQIIPQQAQFVIKRKEPTHYLHKGKFIKRRRF